MRMRKMVMEVDRESNALSSRSGNGVNGLCLSLLLYSPWKIAFIFLYCGPAVIGLL